ncbi:hypothetical protein MUK42_20330 [Musa troglodytarum]|uniref:Uncharacterized protein n=1 Tax=Musa troglodytarum TaxID=320322 RepID=A0A9E7K4T9_9LILI|nr:hypothetical protein MUK42_20330 [Musa troglodytarum]
MCHPFGQRGRRRGGGAVGFGLPLPIRLHMPNGSN